MRKEQSKLAALEHQIAAQPCPVCGGLVLVERLGAYVRHAFCPAPGHYERWGAPPLETGADIGEKEETGR